MAPGGGFVDILKNTEKQQFLYFTRKERIILYLKVPSGVYATRVML
jgi:hypothetical protein